MKTSITMQDKPTRQLALSAVLDILSQFMQCDTLRDSIENCTVWGHPYYERFSFHVHPRYHVREGGLERGTSDPKTIILATMPKRSL
ncbi:hypothetical protein TNCV_1637741 [Trichonephila clavipes]|nr:hypothetical protein TNCV_1637741 [Trichonephila clavipes]